MPPRQPLKLTVALAPDALESLILDLLEWIGPFARPYDEVLEAWRTSCPRFPVWEDARERGLVAIRRDRAQRDSVAVSVLGMAYLRAVRPTIRDDARVMAEDGRHRRHGTEGR